MPTKITVQNDGSLKVEGTDFEIYDAAGEAFDLNGRTRISLCRCGKTEKAPFCDGAHARCGFQSKVIATILPPQKVS